MQVFEIGLVDSAAPQCRYCRFSESVKCDEAVNQEYEHEMICRRNSPVPIVNHADNEYAIGLPAWPIVRDDDWCGQFEAVPVEV